MVTIPKWVVYYLALPTLIVRQTGRSTVVYDISSDAGNLCLIETNRWLANNFLEVSTSNANLVTEKNVFSP